MTTSSKRPLKAGIEVEHHPARARYLKYVSDIRILNRHLVALNIVFFLLLRRVLLRDLFKNISRCLFLIRPVHVFVV
jgi:hypothetical protein